MKKLGVLILGLVLLAPVGVKAQSVGASFNQTFFATSSWVVARTPTTGRYRFINAYRSVDPIGATNTIADYGNVRCGIGEDGRVIVTSCEVTTRIVFLKPDRFLFDPLLRNATVSLTENGVTHTARWTVKEEPPAPTWALHGDGRTTRAEASLRSGAQARGRVLGKRFSTKNDSGFASLRRGGEVNLYYEAEEGTTTESFVHRSTTRRAAWTWIEALIRKETR
ncbi:MAG TPA: hypothetical protein VE174_09285 [Actinomycetota bacterium]|nr:hypothetical protein [Actinomycetota bacterium]